MDKLALAESLFFERPKRFNCSQIVLSALSESYSVPNSMVQEHRAFGGGRAPENTCGSLWAIKSMPNMSREKKREISTRFKEVMGSDKCADIKKGPEFCLKAIKLSIELAL